MTEAHSDDDAIEATAAAFEDEKTSPEVHKRAPGARFGDDAQRPTVIIAWHESRRRARIAELVRSEGWNAVEAHDVEEVIEMTLALSPLVVFVDAEMRGDRETSLPDLLRQHRPGAVMRAVALMEGGSTLDERITLALHDGYDDFIVDFEHEVKFLTQASSNLRAALTLAQLHRQKRDAGLLLELTQTLGSSLDMQLILHTVSRLIAEVIAYERCSIILLDPDDDEAIMVAASEDRAVRDLRIRMTNYPEVQRCVESGAPVLVADVTTDPLLANVSSRLLERGVRTMALFPVVFEEQVTGVLFLRSSLRRSLTDHEVQFGQTVAAACAVAVRNARLFDQFRDQHRHMQSIQIQAERQTEALKKYQDFFEYAADGISVIDVDGHIHYVNKEGRRLLGRTRDELKNLRFPNLLVEDSARQWSEVVDQVRHGRFQRSFDVYVVVGGEERIFSLSAGGVGQATGLLILNFRDVTEMREMEGELRTTKEFLENLINSSVDAIVAADMNGNVMLFNKGAEMMYGYRAGDVIGRMHVSQLYPETGANEVMRRLRDDRWGGRGRLAPERREILTALGGVVPVSMSASIIYEDGEEVATVGVFTDLRDRMAIERQLNEARDQVSKAEKARVAAELAGMAAHELNQPLTSVLGYAEMLKARVPEDDVRLRRPVETIFKQAERMAEIVRKIGRITKYETKRYGANTDMIDLNRAIEDGGRLAPATLGGEVMEADPAGGPSTTRMKDLPAVTPSGTYRGVGRDRARSSVGFDAEDPRGFEDEFTDPRRRRATDTQPVRVIQDGGGSMNASSGGSAGGPGALAALMSLAAPSGPSGSSGHIDASAVVRADTVDEGPAGYAARLRAAEENARQAAARRMSTVPSEEAVTAPPHPAIRGGRPGGGEGVQSSAQSSVGGSRQGGAGATTGASSSKAGEGYSPHADQSEGSGGSAAPEEHTNPGVRLSDLRPRRDRGDRGDQGDQD